MTTSPEELGRANENLEMIGRARRQIEEAQLRADSSRSKSHRSRVRGDRAAMSHASDLVDGYTLEEELHRGGQGVVFRAVQASTGRTVAIKVLAHGTLATQNEQLRFEREVQILGQLKSPGIVRIVDSGVAAGHWWFSMDYVDGIPLDEYVRFQIVEPASGPTLSQSSRSRLVALFAEVAEAVSAAHLRGVIHRDLKPRNILVDRTGQPHLLDFGLARREEIPSDAWASSATAGLTETGQFVGSLPWASPEQAAGPVGAVDMRTDVYSLGVILFQLLTGHFPYQVFGAALDVARNITSAQPADPSSLTTGIDDDLRTIVLTCLSKDATRRYQSAGELARDLRHYLAREPIEAKRDSLLYLLRSRLRRHRAATLVTGVFAITVVAASITSVVLWRSAARERDRAIEAEDAQSALRQIAEVEVEKSTEVNRFLQSVIGAADPGLSNGRELSVRETMQEAIRQLDAGQLAAQPTIEAAVRHSIAQVMKALGQFDDALKQCELALALRERALGPDHRDVAESCTQLSDLLRYLGRRAEAVDAAERAVAIDRRFHEGHDHQDLVTSLQLLAWSYVPSGRFNEANDRMAEAAAMLERLVGPDDVKVVLMRLDRAVMSHGSGASTTEMRAILDELQARLGPNHPQVQTALRMLGAALQMSGDYEGAERCYRESLESVRTVYGEQHPLYIDNINVLVRVIIQRGNVEEGLALMEDTEAAAAEAYGERSFGYAQFLNMRGGLEWQFGRDEVADRCFSASLQLFRDLGRDQGGDGARARIQLAHIRLDQGNVAEVERLARECLAIDEATLAADHWTRAEGKSLLGQVLRRQGNFAEAEQLLLDGYRGLQLAPAWGEFFRNQAARELVALYQAWQAAEPGLEKQAEAEAWRNRVGNQAARQW